VWQLIFLFIPARDVASFTAFCTDQVMAVADLCSQGINQGGEKPLNLAGNNPVTVLC